MVKQYVLQPERIRYVEKCKEVVYKTLNESGLFEQIEGKQPYRVLYDYLDSGYTCIIEWPENIEDLLPEETLRVSITVGDDESRTLHWETL